MKRYFDILGLTENASTKQVKQAYRKLVKQYHPDRNNSSSAQKRFIEIDEAYDAIINVRNGKPAPKSPEFDLNFFHSIFEQQKESEILRRRRELYIWREHEFALINDKRGMIAAIITIISLLFLPITLNIFFESYFPTMNRVLRGGIVLSQMFGGTVTGVIYYLNKSQEIDRIQDQYISKVKEMLRSYKA